jgi:hypothetical protein
MDSLAITLLIALAVFFFILIAWVWFDERNKLTERTRQYTRDYYKKQLPREKEWRDQQQKGHQ